VSSAGRFSALAQDGAERNERATDMILRTSHPVQVLAVLLCATTASAQENRGTPEQRAACTPDAFRLCVGYIPDAGGVEQCLRRNESELSDACRSVFEQSESVVPDRSVPGTGPGRPTRPATLRDGQVGQQ
jgi:hypothetical protein